MHLNIPKRGGSGEKKSKQTYAWYNLDSHGQSYVQIRFAKASALITSLYFQVILVPSLTHFATLTSEPCLAPNPNLSEHNSTTLSSPTPSTFPTRLPPLAHRPCRHHRRKRPLPLPPRLQLDPLPRKNMSVAPAIVHSPRAGT